jgi:hypothetical protein
MGLKESKKVVGSAELDLSVLPFWAGYRAWLRFHRVRLMIVGAVLIALFLAVLFASHTPQDPFTYELY